jgi:hypothetical protein
MIVVIHRSLLVQAAQVVSFVYIQYELKLTIDSN